VNRPCLDCGRPAEGTRCPEHQRAHQRERNAQQSTYGYSSPRWRELRAEALRRDGYRCQRPGCCRTEDLTVHISPDLGGDHARATLADCTTLCRSCHGSTDAARSAATRSQSRPRREPPPMLIQ
jgi:5-methylcytosine-specific restriction protein A